VTSIRRSANPYRRIFTPCLVTEASGGGTQIICSVWLARSCWLWLEDRFEVDFEVDFSGARLSAVVEGVVPGQAPVLTVEGSSALKTARWPPPGPAALPR